MQTLILRDLPVTETLDRKAMGAVRGGMHRRPSGYDFSWSSVYAPVSTVSKKLTADQFIGQSQFVDVKNGVNAAFVDHVNANVNPHQSANNTINQF